jgi:hypothetical protein
MAELIENHLGVFKITSALLDNRVDRACARVHLGPDQHRPLRFSKPLGNVAAHILPLHAK